MRKLKPLYLSTAGEFSYKILATDECGNGSFLGRGTLVVKEMPVTDSSEGQPIIPANAYAYNPQTGLHHKLEATQDTETGEIVVSVNQNGVHL